MAPGPTEVADDPTLRGVATEWPIPALLRAARSTYGSVIRQRLARGRFDDLPPNGPYVLGAVAGGAAPLSEIIRQLGVSKQSGGQLVDALVLRGYLSRSEDPDDRRRVVIGLTPRGRRAAALIGAAVRAVEDRMVAELGAERVSAARVVLAHLIESRETLA